MSLKNKLIEDHSGFSEHYGDSFKRMESKGIHEDEKGILHEFDNSQLCSNDNDDFLETKTHKNKFVSKNTKAKSSLEKIETRKCVSVELFLGLEDDKGANSSSHNFTKVKEKASVSCTRIPASIEEESSDVIHPTPSCKRGSKSIITNTIGAGDSIDQGSCSKEKKQSEMRNSSRTSSSSGEDDSNEGLFFKRKRKQSARFFRKRKHAEMSAKAVLKDGQGKFRRWEFMHPPVSSGNPNQTYCIEIVSAWPGFTSLSFLYQVPSIVLSSFEVNFVLDPFNIVFILRWNW